jgi:hypothetical protein
VKTEKKSSDFTDVENIRNSIADLKKVISEINELDGRKADKDERLEDNEPSPHRPSLNSQDSKRAQTAPTGWRVTAHP